MSICENCISLDTCAVAMPNTEKCFFFVPTEEYRIVNSKEYAIGYEQGRADKEKELQGIKDLGALYSEIRADERAKVFKIIEERLNDDTTITFDLPVEEILGDDIDMDDFLMLAEEIVQQYKSLIFAKLREAYEQSNERDNI